MAVTPEHSPHLHGGLEIRGPGVKLEVVFRLPCWPGLCGQHFCNLERKEKGPDMAAGGGGQLAADGWGAGGAQWFWGV